jgi:transmembrane sensor
MSKEVFHSLLKRYLEGRCTEEEKKIVEQWYNVLDQEGLPAYQEGELQAMDDRLWATLSKKLDDTSEPRRVSFFGRRSTQLGIAASLIAGLLLTGYFVRTDHATPDAIAREAGVTLQMRQNMTVLPVPVQLEDGTRVTLAPGAVLQYPDRFAANKREVFLTGEAFFEVSKDKQRPFLVFSEDLITQVVGTSFTVKAQGAGHPSEVAVVTGKVMVSRNTEGAILRGLLMEERQVYLTPNQRAVLDLETEELAVSLVTEPVPLSAEDAPAERIVFEFEEAPLKTVLHNLERAYGITIQPENVNLYNCTFTGDLSGEDLETRLEFICSSVGAGHTIEGTTIRITGKGCPGGQ